ncbi:MAG: HEXXH motif-containing putative peptide modification protein [Candidatus Binatia bacterium]
MRLSPVTGHGLVLPTAPADATPALRTAYAHYLASACQRFVAAGEWLDPALRPGHARAVAAVRASLGRAQWPTLTCFASPTVGTPLQCLGLRDELPLFAARITAAGAAIVPHVLLELALRGLIPDGPPLCWEMGAPPLASIAIGGQLTAPAIATGLRFSHRHVVAVAGGEEVARLPVERGALAQALAADAGGFTFARCFHRIGAVSHLATVDHNPIAAFEAHPDKAGNHVDLGGRPAAEWVEMLAQCFALVERYLPAEYAEMRTMLHEMVPVGYDDHRHLSASYREAVGTVYLTLHPNVMTMTEAVIHEFQHNKLNVAAYSAEFLTNAFHPRYKSPVRPDPRPLWGILLAVHAFLPVAELYRRMRDGGHAVAASAEFERRLYDIDLKNHEGMEMLRAHAQLTPSGRAMFDELEALERRHLAEHSARGLDTRPTEIHLA